MGKFVKFWAGAIACFLFWSPSVSAQAEAWCSDSEALDRQTTIAQQAALSDLAEANVVYLGETHDAVTIIRDSCRLFKPCISVSRRKINEWRSLWRCSSVLPNLCSTNT